MATEPIFCPCCGGADIVFAEYTTNKGAIICRDCNLKLVAHGDHTGGWRKNATEKWNARVERTCKDVGEMTMVNEELLSLCHYMLRLLEEKCDEPYEPYHGKPCETCAEDCSLDCPKVLRERSQHISGAKVVDE